MDKRTLAAGVVSLAVLSGCTSGSGSGGTTNTSPGQSATNQSATSQSATSQSATTSSFDWKQFAGDSITLLADQNPWETAIAPLLPQFEALTGMKVDLQALPEDQFRQRRQVTLTGQSSSVDVFMTQPVQDGAQFSENGWYTDLTQYVNNPSLTGPDYKFDDISPALLKGATFSGKLIGIPILTDVEMLYYRKDLLAAAGVEVPKTMEELEAAAAKLTKNGVSGYAARGDGGDAVTQLAIYLYNFGADWTDSNGQAAFATPAGVQAFTFYGKMLRNYGPKGVTGDSWQQLMPLFNQGKIAMWDDSSSFVGTMLDPKNSVPEVINNLGYAPMPSGPAGAFNATVPWSLALSPFSTKKNQGWEFIHWATSPDIVAQLQQSGVAGARVSVPFPSSLPQQWVDVFKEDLKVARPKLPNVVPVAQVRDVIGTAMVACIQSESKCASAVATAAKNFNQVVKDNP
jgi:multiple sugar transport system substrate-binding protein